MPLVNVDPVVAVSTMAFLQAVLYISLGCFCAFGMQAISGRAATLADVFFATNRMPSTGSSAHLAYGFGALFAQVPVALAMALLIEHVSQVMDFAVTVAAVHFLLRCVLFGFPREPYWWGIALMTTVVVTVGAEYAVVRRGLGRQQASSMALTQLDDDDDDSAPAAVPEAAAPRGTVKSADIP